MAGICRNQGMVAIAINGMADHAHILFHLPPILSLAKAVQLLKANSSKWMNVTGFCRHVNQDVRVSKDDAARMVCDDARNMRIVEGMCTCVPIGQFSLPNLVKRVLICQREPGLSSGLDLWWRS
jgi:hypothetical protein